MSERISLKSKLLRAGDPWQADISEFKIPLAVNQRLYERDLLNFRRKYSTIEDAQEIATQDMATLSCTFGNPRFCKEHLTIRVGLGLFSKELENQLIGWKPGQSGTVRVKDQPVNVTVEAVRRERLAPFCEPFEVDRDRLAEDLQFLRRKHSFLVPADRVEEGDIATLRCRSETPKFQKDSIPVNVGKGLYSRELEAQLPGLAVGEERNLTAQGAEVAVRILKIERKVLPELTDAFVAKHFESVRTAAELEESVIDVNEDERAQAWADGDRIAREHWRMNGLPLEEMTDEQAQEILGCPTAQAFADWFAGLSADEVSFAALGWELLRAEGREPTEEGYRDAVRKMTEEEGVKPEDLTDYTPPPMPARSAPSIIRMYWKNTRIK